MATGAESWDAHRIAGELVKLHRDGAFSGPGDPEAEFYAQLIHMFGGTYEGKKPRKNSPPL